MAKRKNSVTQSRILVITIAILAALTFASSKDEGATTNLLTKKTNSGVLRLLIWEGHAPQDFVSRFEKKIKTKYDFNIKLQINYATDSDEFYNAIRSGSIDMVMMSHHFFKDERFDFINKKLLLPLNLKNIPNFKQVIPALQNAEYLQSYGQVYASPEAQGPYGLAYNTALLKKEPKSWNILWDPQFNGKYVIGAHEYIYNVIITALALGYSKESINSYDALNNPMFKAKLRQLAVNAHSFWFGVDKADDLSGHLLATAWGDSFNPLLKRGEHWKMAEPAEGMPCWIDNYAIASTLANKPFLKKIAEEFINTVLTPDYQVGIIMRTVGTIPVITKIEHLLTPNEKKRIHVGQPNFYKKNRMLLPTYSTRDRNGLKLLWEEAMRGILSQDAR